MCSRSSPSCDSCTRAAAGKHLVAHDKSYAQVLLPLRRELLGRSLRVRVTEVAKFYVRAEILDDGGAVADATARGYVEAWERGHARGAWVLDVFELCGRVLAKALLEQQVRSCACGKMLDINGCGGI